MDEIHVTGKASLSGEIFIQGSKNAALPMIAASLMHRGLSILRGCPRISDVFCMEEILKSLGAVTWWDDHDLYLDCSCADGTEIPAVYTGRMRSSIILAGAVLARNRKCRIGYPGGCTIGKRPIDLHLMALRALGADVRENASGLDGECVRFEGQDIVFPKSSVGAAQQAILAAVLAKGVTHLYNCAKEPEVFWLCRYLKTMGALIEGEETGEITIRGVDELKGGDYRIPPDRIVAGTYLCAAAAARSKIILHNVPVEELQSFMEVYRKIGGQYSGIGGKLLVNGKNVHSPVAFLETGVYPGFPTDLQSPLMAVLATVEGTSLIREAIFEDRYKAAPELVRMGADIRILGRDALIQGGKPLTGTFVRAQELRGGAALILAALVAAGTTVLEGYSFVRRGYEHICQDLEQLGAAVKRIQE